MIAFNHFFGAFFFKFSINSIIPFYLQTILIYSNSSYIPLFHAISHAFSHFSSILNIYIFKQLSIIFSAYTPARSKALFYDNNYASIS